MNTLTGENRPAPDKKTLWIRAARFFKSLYLRLFRINDNPHKIALGFSLGVFLGVLPGTGPVAALVLAVALKLNRAAALLGGILTNTWLSIPVFFVSVQVGALATGRTVDSLSDQWGALARDFHWRKLLSSSIYEFVFPIAAGYLLVSAVLGLIAYAVIFLIVRRRQINRRRGHEGVNQPGDKI